VSDLHLPIPVVSIRTPVKGVTGAGFGISVGHEVSIRTPVKGVTSATWY